MSRQVDLHLHSTASDGIYTPAELVQLALDKAIQVIALTDHDTTEGIEEALDAAQGTGLTVVPGVEISTDVPGNRELHILGYHIDRHDAPLQECLEELRQSRLERVRKMVDLLAQAGCNLELDRLMAIAGRGSVGRPHIAQAMVEANCVNSVASAFRLYIGRGAPAYGFRSKLTAQEAIQIVLEAGGVPVLAHPSQLVEHIPELVRYGLAGLEVYYDGYEGAEKRFLAGLAQKYDLIATGGSDFHGPGITRAVDIGQVAVPWSAVEQLRMYARNIAPGKGSEE